MRELFSGDFRLWLLGQHDRQDRVGKAARVVLGCPQCTGDDHYQLFAHVSREHPRNEVLALLSAVHEWQHEVANLDLRQRGS